MFEQAQAKAWDMADFWGAREALEMAKRESLEGKYPAEYCRIVVNTLLEML
jgi:hypothetical protein